MSASIIASAVNLLEEPIIIMESKTVDDSIIILGEIYTKADNPVMISLLLKPKTKTGEILDYEYVTSAYGRKSNNLQNLINSSEIYYVCENKKRTDKWLSALGLQLPSAITKYGPINRILTNFEKVKKNNIKNSDRDAEYLELAKNPEKNEKRLRKLVDATAKEKGYVLHNYISSEIYNQNEDI